jgi:hypothetical protein
VKKEKQGTERSVKEPKKRVADLEEVIQGVAPARLSRGAKN